MFGLNYRAGTPITIGKQPSTDPKCVRIARSPLPVRSPKPDSRKTTPKKTSFAAFTIPRPSRAEAAVQFWCGADRSGSRMRGDDGGGVVRAVRCDGASWIGHPLSQAYFRCKTLTFRTIPVSDAAGSGGRESWCTPFLALRLATAISSGATRPVRKARASRSGAEKPSGSQGHLSSFTGCGRQHATGRGSS